MTMTQNTSAAKPLTLGIVGVGLIGASSGLAHKQAKTFDNVHKADQYEKDKKYDKTAGKVHKMK